MAGSPVFVPDCGRVASVAVLLQVLHWALGSPHITAHPVGQFWG